MSPLEAIAALFGLINIVLIAQRSLLNYPFGVVTVCLYFMVFWQARLYSAAGLQVFFLAAQLYGWWYWHRALAGVAGPVPVRTLRPASVGLAFAAGICGTALLGLVMSRHTDAAAPWLDAGNAAWSMVAQILTDRRHIESWPFWIAINIVSIWLYASQDLIATAGLYAVYLGIAAWGWHSWRRVAC